MGILHDRMTVPVQGITGEDAFTWLVKGKKAEVSGGLSVIHGEIGQLDFRPFKKILTCTMIALDDNQTGYGPTAGDVELRQAIAEYSNRFHYGHKCQSGQVIVSMGAKSILYAALEMFVNPGDRVVYFTPGYPIYKAVTKMRGGIPVPVELRAENKYNPDLQELDMAAQGAKILIVNSPQNPIGSVFDYDIQRGIAAIAVKYDLIVIADEAYSRMLYDGREFVSIVTFDGMAERTIIDDSLSKTGSIPGYRLGWGIVPLDIVKEFTTILGNIYSCCPAFTQAGALAALTDASGQFDKFVNGMVTELQARRDILLSALSDIPYISCYPPEGAFYLWLDIKATSLSSQVFAERFLAEQHVVSLPGTSFGAAGEGFIRISFGSLGLPDLVELPRRLAEFVTAIQ